MHAFEADTVNLRLAPCLGTTKTRQEVPLALPDNRKYFCHLSYYLSFVFKNNLQKDHLTRNTTTGHVALNKVFFVFESFNHHTFTYVDAPFEIVISVIIFQMTYKQTNQLAKDSCK